MPTYYRPTYSLRPTTLDLLSRRELQLYEELGRLLATDDPHAAVAVYCSYPYGTPGGDSDAFGENGLRLAAAKLLLKLEMFQVLCHPTHLPTYRPACLLPTSYLPFLFTYPPTHLLTHSPTYCLPTHLRTTLRTLGCSSAW